MLLEANWRWKLLCLPLCALRFKEFFHNVCYINYSCVAKKAGFSPVDSAIDGSSAGSPTGMGNPATDCRIPNEISSRLRDTPLVLMSASVQVYVVVGHVTPRFDWRFAIGSPVKSFDWLFWIVVYCLFVYALARTRLAMRSCFVDWLVTIRFSEKKWDSVLGMIRSAIESNELINRVMIDP